MIIMSPLRSFDAEEGEDVVPKSGEVIVYSGCTGSEEKDLMNA